MVILIFHIRSIIQKKRVFVNPKTNNNAIIFRKWHNKPTNERKILKKEGVNLKDYKEVVKATADLREKNKPAPKELPPTQEELLTEILAELRKQNATETKEEHKTEEIKAEEKPKKTRKKKEVKE